MHKFGPSIPAQALVAKLRQHVKEFCRARQAIAAVEFALVLPLLVILMLGSVEAARLIISAQRVTLVATTIVEMLTQNRTAAGTQAGTQAVAAAGNGKVDYIDLHLALDSTMVIFPQILQDASQKGISWKNDIAISMASVVFTPNPPSCTSNCSYNANVVWNSGPNKRTCGVQLTTAPDTSVPNKTTLPADVFGPGSIIVVDIVFNYTPIFGLGLFGTIPIARSAYLAPRYAPFNVTPPPSPVPYINYDVVSGDDGIGAKCPGY